MKMNKYQEALNKIIRSCCPYCNDNNGCQNCEIKQTCNATAKSWVDTLQELVVKETPMKVDKEHYDLVDSDAGEYFIVSDYYYKCPNSKCKLHKKYEIYFEEKRCPECNQLLDWGGKKNAKNK
jgi:hypothetical protein